MTLIAGQYWSISLTLFFYPFIPRFIKLLPRLLIWNVIPVRSTAFRYLPWGSFPLINSMNTVKWQSLLIWTQNQRPIFFSAYLVDNYWIGFRPAAAPWLVFFGTFLKWKILQAHACANIFLGSEWARAFTLPKVTLVWTRSESTLAKWERDSQSIIPKYLEL